MSAQRPVIFVSASYKELSTVRALVKKRVTKLGAQPGLDIPAGMAPAERFQAILKAVAESDLVIHLAGMSSGETPPPAALREILERWEQASPGFAGQLGLKPKDSISYAQLEVRLAYALGKPVHFWVLAERYPSDAHPPEPMPQRVLQQAHRKVLGEAASGAVQPRTPVELEIELKKLKIPGAKPPRITRERLRVAAMAAGAVLLLGAMGWGGMMGWGDLHKTVDLDIDAKKLAEDLSIRTIPHVMAGVITSAEQRYTNAERQAAAQMGLSVPELRSALQHFAEETAKDPKASNYDRGLAAFVQKDYATAERMAMRDAPSTENSIANSAPQESRNALYLAMRAQFAQNHLADAAETSYRPTPGYRQGAPIPHAAIMQFLLDRAVMSAEKGGSGTWDTLCAMVEHHANGYGEDGLRYTPDEELAIRSWGVEELAISGKVTDALASADQLAAECASLHGGDSAEASHARALKCSILISEGRLTEAESLLGEALKHLPKDASVDDPNATELPMLRSKWCLATGNLKEAMDTAETVAKQRLKVLGEDHPATAEALSQWALTLQALGSFTKAEETQKKALAILNWCHGPRERAIMEARRRLAMIWLDQGRFTEVKEALKACFKIEKQTITDNETELSVMENSIATVCSEMGDLDEAQTYASDALARIQRIKGQQSFMLGTILINLGQIQLKSGHAGQGQSYLRQAIYLMDKTGTGRSPVFASCLKVFSDCLRDEGKTVEEESCLKQAGSILENDGATHHPLYGVVLLQRGRQKAATGHFEDAVKDLEAGDIVLKASLPAGHWRFAWSEFVHAQVLQMMGQEDAAISLGRVAVEHYRKSVPDWETSIASVDACVRRWEEIRHARAIQPLPGETKEQYIERMRRLKDHPELHDQHTPEKPSVQI